MITKNNKRILWSCFMAAEIFSTAGIAIALTLGGLAIGYGILWVWNGGKFSEEE